MVGLALRPTSLVFSRGSPLIKAVDMRLVCSIFSPLEDESSLNAEENYRFLSFILMFYGKAWEKVSCLVGGNCSTNKAIARRAEVLLVCCASHRFNLAVRMLLRDDEVLL